MSEQVPQLNDASDSSKRAWRWRKKEQIIFWLIRISSRLAPSEQARVFMLTVAVGAVCGFVAVMFHLAIRFAERQFIGRALSAPGNSWLILTIAVATLGALITGILLHKVAPMARGSGIPEVKYIYAVKSGSLRLRDAVAKFFIAALQIGSGSSLGREGPTVFICATVARRLGHVFALSPSNQRRLIPVGAAAGVAAAFNAPIAAVTFVIEELVGALDTTVLSGVVVAAALAAVIERSVLGEHPVFQVPNTYSLSHASSLLTYTMLGVGAGLVGTFFTRLLLRTRGAFQRTKLLPRWSQPAVGAAVTGALAVLAIAWVDARGITGGGYQTLGEALRGTLGLKVMMVLCIFKLLATVSSYSSGGAGGIFAPTLFIGGMLGGLFGDADQWLWNHSTREAGAFALVGMGAAFAAVVRAPITSILIIFEMTGSYGLVLPLMITNSVAYLLARQLHPTSIYEALLEQDGRRLPNSTQAMPALASLHVRDAMTRAVVVIPVTATVEEACASIGHLPYKSYPVVDDKNRMMGIVTDDLLHKLEAEGKEKALIGDHARMREYLRGGQTLGEALIAMSRLTIRQMAVVDDETRTHPIGILSMSDAMRALVQTGGAQGNT